MPSHTSLAKPKGIRRELVVGHVFAAWDRLRGRRVVPTLDRLRVSQWWDRSELIALQEDRLQRLVRHAYERVPFYRDAMQGRRLIPDDIRSVEDLARLPLLERSHVREHFPRRLRADDRAEKELLVGRTGGSSTGEPLFFGFDRGTMDYARASLYRAYEWADCPVGTPTLVLWGAALEEPRLLGRLRGQLERGLLGIKHFNAFRMTDALLEKCGALLFNGRVDFVYGYVSAIEELCRYLIRQGIRPRSVRSVMTTAEVLHPNVRTLIERCFDARVFDGYGFGEVNGVAYECHQHDGLHVAMERAVIETVDDEGQPVPPGRPGRIAVTDLHNYAMPLIRYVNGDEAILNADRCSCGRHLVRLQQLLGRTCDIIDGVNGQRLHSYFFASLFGDLGWSDEFGLSRFQVVQENGRDLRIELVVARRPGVEDEKLLRSKIQGYLGDMHLSINYPDAIEAQGSGKFRWTINRARTAGSPGAERD